MAKRGLIIASNRLPITVKEEAGKLSVERAIGGVATALDAVAKKYQARWVGCTGLPRVLPATDLTTAGMPEDLIPVQAGLNIFRCYYDNFSNQFLWPNLHGMFTDFIPSSKDWEAFKGMNRRFAESIKVTIRSADEMIWVHDYHLMLLPLYLRQAGVNNPIGYFLHVPFPEPMHWFELSYAQELAEGVAAADLVGLQTKKDAKHLKHYLDMANISVRGMIKVFPIGIDYDSFHAAANRSPVRRLQQKIRKQTNGKKIIFSLSRLDYTKGILTQLQAVRRFLRQYAERRNVVYKLVVAPSRDHLPEYNRLSKDIKKGVDSINQDIGSKDWQPVDYESKAIGFDEATAWYNAADLLLLLPDADGMNLIAKEYMAARQDDKGMAVLSTAMGASEQLDEALLVPPADADAAALALRRAFEMPESERPRRWRALRDVVRRQDIFWWADRFLSTLAVIKKL